LNGTTCETSEVECLNGEYYDSTSLIWRPWNGSWNGLWQYQAICLEWPPGKILDLDTLKWVSAWTSAQKLIDSGEFKILPVCRSGDYYVDPWSDSVLELGTLDYPYKSMEAVITEIINIHSHSKADITIYTKDVYIEDGIQFYLNISSISFYPHPHYADQNRRAIIIPTIIPQQIISTKTNYFHLLCKNLF